MHAFGPNQGSRVKETEGAFTALDRMGEARSCSPGRRALGLQDKTGTFTPAKGASGGLAQRWGSSGQSMVPQLPDREPFPPVLGLAPVRIPGTHRPHAGRPGYVNGGSRVRGLGVSTPMCTLEHSLRNSSV